MNKLAKILSLAFVAAWPVFGQTQGALEKEPAYLAIDQAIDFKTIRPEVNVNLPHFLLQDAVSEFDGGKDDPLAKTGVNVAELVKEIKLIRVVVIEAKETNRAALARSVIGLSAVRTSGVSSLI